MNTSSFPCIEVLRGRDGRDGRDGVPGTRGWTERRRQRAEGRPRTNRSLCPRNGGGKALVQCLEHGINIREEQPTTSACLMIQTISATHLEYKKTTMCMEQSARQGEHHRQLSTTTISPVLCAMLQQGWQSQ